MGQDNRATPPPQPPLIARKRMEEEVCDGGEGEREVSSREGFGREGGRGLVEKASAVRRPGRDLSRLFRCQSHSLHYQNLSQKMLLQLFFQVEHRSINSFFCCLIDLY